MADDGNHCPRVRRPDPSARRSQSTAADHALMKSITDGDPWLDPLLVINRRFRFEHGPEDVAAARDFIGPLEEAGGSSLARALVTRVKERVCIRASAFGVGMPK